MTNDLGDIKAFVRDGYDRVSHAYRGDVHDDPRSGYAHWLRKLTPRLADGARVLDLGCGNGVPVSRELARRFRVTGVDLSPVMIERARVLVPDATFECADMASVEFADGAFEAVVAFFSIFHLPLEEQPGTIERVARWLTPGGWFFAIVGKYAWTGTERNWQGVPGATMWWSHADIATYRGWFERANFEIAEEGSQPEKGAPGFSVLLGRKRG